MPPEVIKRAVHMATRPAAKYESQCAPILSIAAMMYGTPELLCL